MKIKQVYQITVVLCLCLCLFVQTICAQEQSDSYENYEISGSTHHQNTTDSQPEMRQASDTVHILSCGHCAPYDFVNTSGQIDGYAITILLEILHRREIPFMIHDLPRLVRLDSLQFNGPVLIPGSNIKHAAWSRAFVQTTALYETHTVTVVLEDSSITSIEELKNEPIAQAVELEMMTDVSDSTHEDKVAFSGNVSSCLRMLFAGEVKAVKASREVIAFFMLQMDSKKQLKELSSKKYTHYLSVDSLHTSIIPIIEDELAEMQHAGYIDEVRYRYTPIPTDDSDLLFIYIGLVVWTLGLIVTVAYYRFIFRTKYTRWRTEQRAVRVLRAIMDNMPTRLRVQKIAVSDLQSDVSPYRLSEETHFYKRYFHTTNALPDGVALACDADVTDMEILSKDQNKSDYLRISLLTNLSHNIRTPLNTVLRFTQLLVDEGEQMDSAYRDQCLTLIRKNSDLMIKLVDDIADNPEKKLPSILDDTQQVDCVEMMSDIEFQYSSILSQQDVKFEMLLPFTKLDVMCHKSRLLQVIHNLLDNAVRYTSSGTVQCGMTVSDSKELVFFCRDTGVGISEADIPLIFNRFFTVDDNSTESGLGLSICRSIIKKAQGSIDVASKENEGSLFWVSVPLHLDYEYSNEKNNIDYTHILSEISNNTYSSDEKQ